jgi:hypothetical protein
MTSLLYLTAVNTVTKKEEKVQIDRIKPEANKPQFKIPTFDKQSIKPLPQKVEEDVMKPLKKFINNNVPRNAKSVTFFRKKKDKKMNENNFFSDIGDRFTMENLELKYENEIRKHKRELDLNQNEFDKKKNLLKHLELKMEEVN